MHGTHSIRSNGLRRYGRSAFSPRRPPSLHRLVVRNIVVLNNRNIMGHSKRPTNIVVVLIEFECKPRAFLMLVHVRFSKFFRIILSFSLFKYFICFQLTSLYFCVRAKKYVKIAHDLCCKCHLLHYCTILYLCFRRRNKISTRIFLFKFGNHLPN